MIVLRDYQDQLIADIARAFGSGHRAVLAVSPCGSGKTPAIAKMIAGANMKGIPAITTVPRIDLMRQTRRTFENMGVDGRLDTIQARRRGVLTDKFIVIDEAHWGFSPAWVARLRLAIDGGARVLGFTASPIPGMDQIFTAMVEGPSVAELMARGYLSDFRPFGPSQPDLSGVPTRATEYGRDYAAGPAAEVMGAPSITGDIIKHWRRLAEGKRTIGYAVSRERAKRLVRDLISAGIPAEHVDGDSTHDERTGAFARFARRETQILFNVALFQLGTDISSIVGEDVPIEAMIDAAPTKSVPLAVQKWGRPMRPKPDGSAAIMLDHANNFRDLQMFPDTEVEWSISKGTVKKSGERAISVSICSRCFGAFKIAPECPYCGAERQLTPREVEEREGELRELERERERKAKRIEQGRAQTMAELIEIGRAKGMKNPSGWAHYVMTARAHYVMTARAAKGR